MTSVTITTRRLRCHDAGHFVWHCPKAVWFVPGRPETDADSEAGNNENDIVNDNDGNGAAADNVAEPVVVPDGGVEPVVSQQCSMSGLGAPMAVDPEAGLGLGLDVRDNELNELDSQPLLVSGSEGG